MENAINSNIKTKSLLSYKYYVQMKELELLKNKAVYTKLNIFDFDNTLFNSPGPNPKLWDRYSIGLMKSESLGWYQNKASIDTTHINPAANWFDKQTLESAKKCLTQSDQLTIMLTGRGRDGFHEIIQDFLKQATLEFPFFALKEQPTNGNKKLSTFDFKKRIILEFLSMYKDINSVEIYEDRDSQIEKFEKMFKSKIFVGGSLKEYQIKINKIILQPAYYPFYLELKIVQQLVEAHKQKHKEISYIVKVPDLLLELDEISTNKIKECTPSTKAGPNKFIVLLDEHKFEVTTELVRDYPKPILFKAESFCSVNDILYLKGLFSVVDSVKLNETPLVLSANLTENVSQKNYPWEELGNITSVTGCLTFSNSSKFKITNTDGWYRRKKSKHT